MNYIRLLSKPYGNGNLLRRLIGLLLSLYLTSCLAIEVPIYDFPLIYSQNTNDYLSPDAENYDKSLLSFEYQQLQLKQFYNHYYSSNSQGLSPWSAEMVATVLPFTQKIESEILEDFNNQNKVTADKHYGGNFKEHDFIWWNKIKDNMDLNALTSSEFREENRAISVTNTYARSLPDSAPDFLHPSLPGQGFPFDNLQQSAIWAGTPLYVLSVTKDKAWSLVLTPDGYFDWVKSTDIAYVSSSFIGKWQEAAQHSLVAVTETETTIFDEQKQFQLTAYIGAVFPMIMRNDEQTSILIPVKNIDNQAVIKTGIISSIAAQIMPLKASPKNLVQIINQLKNRPYGWGGSFFFNDCSQEMKSLFTPFAIWLPKYSGQQAQLSSTLDLSKNSVDERLNLLKEKGHPLMTIIYIGGHVMLYVGNKKIDNNTVAAITYQNLWGMSPNNRDKRYVIGKSLFFPLLKSYPENSDVSSLADKAKFKLIFLDEINSNTYTPQSFARRFLAERNS